MSKYERIQLSDKDQYDIDCACEVKGVKLTFDQKWKLMYDNPKIYRLGMLWGFNDTEVREWVCEKVEEMK